MAQDRSLPLHDNPPPRRLTVLPIPVDSPTHTSLAHGLLTRLPGCGRSQAHPWRLHPYSPVYTAAQLRSTACCRVEITDGECSRLCMVSVALGQTRRQKGAIRPVFGCPRERTECGSPCHLSHFNRTFTTKPKPGDGSLDDLGPFEAVGAKNLGRRCYSRG